MSLQTLVEGMVLEVHITEIPAAPLTPGKDPLTPTKTGGDEGTITEGAITEGPTKEPREESIVLKWFHIEPAPLVELYTRFGSDVRQECVCVCVWCVDSFMCALCVLMCCWL